MQVLACGAIYRPERREASKHGSAKFPFSGERVTALGGGFEILSEGEGTTVKVAIPLQANVCERASAAHA